MRRTNLASDLGIGEVLSDYMRGNVLETKSIVSQFPQVEAEHLLIQIPEEMKGFHAHVGTFDSALQQAPEVFESVGVNLPVNVFLGMVNHMMLEILVFQSLIGKQRIGVNRAASLDVMANLSLKVMLAASGNHHCANFSATFHDAEHGSLILHAAFGNHALVLVGVHESGSTTDEGFVYFYLRTTATEFRTGIALHRKADSVEHEPCGLLSDAKSAGHFVRTHAILAVGNHPHCDKPLIERQCRIFKDGSNLHRKLTMSMDALALPFPLILKEYCIFTATCRASHFAIRPAHFDHEGKAIIGICEVNDGLLKCLWLVHIFHLTQRYQRQFDLSSILLPSDVRE
jgi:hypothetical protein